MKTLITGAHGFLGGFLSGFLLAHGDEVTELTRHPQGAGRPASRFAGEQDEGGPRARPVQADLRDASAVARAIADARPDRIFHLAAWSHIPSSFDDPVQTFTVNVIGTVHLLAAIRQHSPGAVIVSVGSSAEYGDTCRSREKVSEEDCLLPTSPYGVSKVAQGLACRQAFRSYGTRAIHVRPFQIIGPFKRNDALSQFAAQVARFEREPSSEAVLRVGNLSPTRDFVDVRDCIAALVLLAERGEAGQSYNICTGRATQLTQLVEMLRSVARRHFEVAQDASLLRPVDDMRIVGDPRKLAALGHVARHDLVETINDTLQFFRTDAPG
jgi:GDP-4-dehydro-6-deoxy-D-mannose reductase